MIYCGETWLKILLFCSSFENLFAISQAVRYPGNVFIYLILLKEAGGQSKAISVTKWESLW